MDLCREAESWYGLYHKDYDLATPESMAHPAKCSWDLAFKINEHLEELGLLKLGDTVLDFMAGTSRIPIAACAKGYKAIAVELEEKFIKFSEANRDYASKKLGREIELKVIQGDARRLSELLQGHNLIGQISPPYGDMCHPTNYLGKEKRESCQEYSDNPGNIGNLPDRGYIGEVSPPYEDALTSSSQHGNSGIAAREPKLGNLGRYGVVSKGQIGQEQGQTYLEAMRQVYAEALKVCSVLVVITKNPTRKGKLRRLDLDTLALLQEVGWKVICQHRAILFTEQEQATLFGKTQKKVKGRMSFFKRLSWQKGSPVAQWEDVVFCVRDGEGACPTDKLPRQ